MDLPLVSIITLAYNSIYLYDTINSVLEQKYENIEYIISDDGTEGFSVNNIKKYILLKKKRNIKKLVVVKSTQNQGTAKNLNKALKQVKGKYIIFLSADDIFLTIM